ncbi:fumarylacetoacetate hydrolase family protein [Pseudogracilibacillus sp. SO30301A]|uniref:fumarylacetoacetate hydrolase family protein n=1 Tax=Pseudogracilibacillus sp. SO30301A TaxID=3098291 RepID=UPI00300E4933
MKLLTFKKENTYALGVKMDEGIIDVKKAVELFPENGVATDMMELIEGGDEAVRRLKQFVKSLDYKGAGFAKKEDEIKWGPAVTRPSKIICVGLNYKKHADETKSKYPEEPILFNKFDNALTGHLTEIEVPRTTERLDHEVELGIVIGKTGKFINEENALDFVLGYCTTNDLSARDIQKRSPQWMLGKTNDGFAPVGPYLVTKSEVENPNSLQLTTTVNGEVRQNSNTADMIFSCEQLISYISNYMTLKPGDLIMTGTPEGVILGRPIEERVYLQPGDTVTVEVEKLGALTNTFVEDKG